MGRYANFQGCARKSYDVRVGNIMTFAAWCFDYGSPHRIWQTSDTGRMRNEVLLLILLGECFLELQNAPKNTW